MRAAELPRTDYEDHDGLDSHHERGKEHHHGGPMHLPESTLKAIFTSPIDELRKVEH